MSGDQKRYENLVNRAVDGLLTPDEQAELDDLLARDPARASELDDFMMLKGETDAMTQRIQATAKGRQPRESRAEKTGLRLSFGMIFASIVGAVAVETYFFFMAPNVSMVAKVLGGLLGAGLSGLFAHALKIRIRDLNNDPYQEIDR